jgi:D-serine dehydratase
MNSRTLFLPYKVRVQVLQAKNLAKNIEALQAHRRHFGRLPCRVK